MYCEHGGSSSGVRQLLDEAEATAESRLFKEFREKNQQLEIELVQRNSFHPVLVGHYIDGRLLRDGERVPKQVG
jgi:hypothetical protein